VGLVIGETTEWRKDYGGDAIRALHGEFHDLVRLDLLDREWRATLG
jgi:hypothetical protein